MIHDTSASGYFCDPTAKIDISVVDCPIVTWPHLIIPIELKCNLKRDQKSALAQLSNLFSDILDQQPEREFVIGAIAPDVQIELVRMDKGRNFQLAGPIPLDLSDKTSVGLDVLTRLVTSSYAANGYCPPSDTSRQIISAGINQLSI